MINIRAGIFMSMSMAVFMSLSIFVFKFFIIIKVCFCMTHRQGSSGIICFGQRRFFEYNSLGQCSLYSMEPVLDSIVASSLE